MVHHFTHIAAQLADTPLWAKVFAGGAVVVGWIASAVGSDLSLWEAVGRDAKYLGVLVLLVVLFLRFLSGMASEMKGLLAERDRVFSESLTAINDGNHEVMSRATEALDRQAEQAGRLSALLDVIDLRRRRRPDS